MRLSKLMNILVLVILILIIGCSKNDDKDFARNLDFNQGWRFLEANPQKAYQLDFDDSDWRLVDLPHDWSIEDQPVQDSVHIGPFDKTMESGHDVGYLRGGTGWYRKRLIIPENYK